MQPLLCAVSRKFALDGWRHHQRCNAPPTRSRLFSAALLLQVGLTIFELLGRYWTAVSRDTSLLRNQENFALYKRFLYTFQVGMERAGLQLLLLFVALIVDVCKFLGKFHDGVGKALYEMECTASHRRREEI